MRYRGEEPQSDDITMLAFCRPDPESGTEPVSAESHTRSEQSVFLSPKQNIQASPMTTQTHTPDPPDIPAQQL